MAEAVPAGEKPAGEKKAEAGGSRLAKKALLAQVVAATGAKPKDVKPILEATLDAIAQALGRGESLVLPPLGRLTVRPQREGANARVMTVKVRRTADKAEHASQALAEADEAH